MARTSETKGEKKKDLMYWVKLLTLIVPLVGGGGYGATKYFDEDEDSERFQKIDVEERPVIMQQDDNLVGNQNEVINLDDPTSDDDNEDDNDDD